MLYIGKVVKAQVVKIQKTHFIVKVQDKEDAWKGLVHISNLSDYYVDDINQFVKLNKDIWLKVIAIDAPNRTLKLDFKSLHPKYARDPYDYEIKETPTGFETLRTWNKKIGDSDDQS